MNQFRQQKKIGKIDENNSGCQLWAVWSHLFVGDLPPICTKHFAPFFPDEDSEGVEFFVRLPFTRKYHMSRY